MEEALGLASRLANGPTVAFGFIRKLYWDSPQNDYEQQLDAEQRAQDQASRTDDFREGLIAFRAKRPAEFKGR
jgi:2-(1,2-epoxy-1,2-dihydrophenyl)acetyl-CoA isomerase